MKRADKLLLFFGSLICLGLSIGLLSIFYPLPFVSDWVNMMRDWYFWFDIIFEVFCVFICVLFLALMLLAIFSPAKRNSLILPKSRGTLKFSKQAIESTVRHSYAEVSGINFSQVNVKISKKPEKLKVFVRMSLSDLSGLVELTETVQARIEAALLSSLGITAKTINVKVMKYNSENKAQSESGENTPAESRVV